MGQNYSQLTDGERNQFYALRKVKMPMTEIANQLGRSRATLYNELARNTGGRGYRHHIHQGKTSATMVAGANRKRHENRS